MAGTLGGGLDRPTDSRTTQIEHALAQHVKTYSATCTTESDWPKIRLSTSTYPPDSTPPPPMVHSIAQEYDFLYPSDLEPESSEEQ